MELTITRHDLGLSWTVRERLERSSHALASERQVWLIDPVDDAAVREPIRELGSPAAVLQLLDRHNRDCELLARELGVPHVRVPDALPDSPFQFVPVMRRARWREVALWWPEQRALAVAEALGTAPLFALGGAPVGVHPLLRLAPPRGLAAFEPAYLFVGHGPPLEGPDLGANIHEALERSRRYLPRVLTAAGDPALASSAAGLAWATGRTTGSGDGLLRERSELSKAASTPSTEKPTPTQSAGLKPPRKRRRAVDTGARKDTCQDGDAEHAPELADRAVRARGDSGLGEGTEPSIGVRDRREHHADADPGDQRRPARAARIRMRAVTARRSMPVQSPAVSETRDHERAVAEAVCQCAGDRGETHRPPPSRGACRMPALSGECPRQIWSSCAIRNSEPNVPRT